MPSRVLGTKWLLYHCVISMILTRTSFKFCLLGRSCPGSGEEQGSFDSLGAVGSEVRTRTRALWELGLGFVPRPPLLWASGIDTFLTPVLTTQPSRQDSVSPAVQAQGLGTCSAWARASGGSSSPGLTSLHSCPQCCSRRSTLVTRPPSRAHCPACPWTRTRSPNPASWVPRAASASHRCLAISWCPWQPHQGWGSHRPPRRPTPCTCVGRVACGSWTSHGCSLPSRAPTGTTWCCPGGL